MKLWTMNPPAKASIANNPESFATLPRERRNGRLNPDGRTSDSTFSDAEAPRSAPSRPPGTNTRKNRSSSGPQPSSSRRSDGPPAARAPSEPTTAAIALYLPNTRVRSFGSSPAGSIACSSDVNGPDSPTSGGRVPARAAPATRVQRSPQQHRPEAVDKRAQPLRDVYAADIRVQREVGNGQ